MAKEGRGVPENCNPGHQAQASQYPSFKPGKMSPDISPGHLAERRMENCKRFLLRLLSFLVYQLNKFFAEALVSTRNLEDLGVAFLGQSLFRKCPLHL